jgi:hypothetical protein
MRDVHGGYGGYGGRLDNKKPIDVRDAPRNGSMRPGHVVGCSSKAYVMWESEFG